MERYRVNKVESVIGFGEKVRENDGFKAIVSFVETQYASGGGSRLMLQSVLAYLVSLYLWLSLSLTPMGVSAGASVIILAIWGVSLAMLWAGAIWATAQSSLETAVKVVILVGLAWLGAGVAVMTLLGGVALIFLAMLS